MRAIRKPKITNLVTGPIELLLVAFMLFGCERLDPARKLIIKTRTISEISHNSCMATGEIIDLSDNGITQHGFCWSETGTPTISLDTKSQLGSKNTVGEFSQTVSDLSANTTYYIRAYATDNSITAYGEEVSFTTATGYPANGLVSYFNFDRNLEDQLGNTPDGTNYGGATYTFGKSDYAISLNGTNQYIVFGRKTFKNGNNISVSLWLKKPDTAESLKFFVMCSDFAVATQTGYVSYVISVPTTNNAKGVIASNTWVHMAGTYDGTNINIYINSVLAETKYHPGNISDPDRNLTLGFFNSQYWGGSIDDLFIYNRVLTQDEVDQLYQY